MENCLVTTLKDSVNNPNLPYLEVMQQITLDAIAASGNSSMTDAQKLALNHFFYQIGAVKGQNSVYTKIYSMVLPLLASDSEHALYDYKKGSMLSPSSGTVVLTSNAVYASGDSSEIRLYETWNLTNSSVVLSPTTLSENNINYFRLINGTTGATGTLNIKTNAIYIALSPKQTYNQSLVADLPANSKTIGLSIGGTATNNTFLYAANENNITKIIPRIKSDFVNVEANRADIRVFGSYGLYFIVSSTFAMSDSEIKILTESLEDLKNAFVG